MALALTFLNTLKATILLIPAILYCWFAVEYWEVLKAEGVTVWHAGTGLVALYGLGLHWWSEVASPIRTAWRLS